MILAIRDRMEKDEKGFTLIELLVVVIIIGILAAVAIPVFLNQRQRAYRAAAQSDLRNIAVEAETYFTDNTTYQGFAVPANYGSPQVTTARVGDQAATYCFTAVHSQMSPAEPWQIEPGNQLERGDCT